MLQIVTNKNYVSLFIVVEKLPLEVNLILLITIINSKLRYVIM